MSLPPVPAPPDLLDASDMALLTAAERQAEYVIRTCTHPAEYPEGLEPILAHLDTLLADTWGRRSDVVRGLLIGLEAEGYGPLSNEVRTAFAAAYHWLTGIAPAALVSEVHPTLTPAAAD